MYCFKMFEKLFLLVLITENKMFVPLRLFYTNTKAFYTNKFFNI